MAKYIMADGNEVTARVAFACSEVAAIFPITPSSQMGELAEEWAAQKQKNLWNTVPLIVELQSEAGAAGAIHGALTTGSLATTFTSSQGLLLMIPNMYKIAGELAPTVFHVASRALATQGLSIFADHGDVMACRQTGFAMLVSNSVQESADMALIAHSATLESRIPFLHFFDGFRTSHEVQKIEDLSMETIRAMIDEDQVNAFRARGLSPERPVMRGTAQNPDVYFQGRETVNPYYAATPGIVQAKMDALAKLTGRQYNLFDYEGVADAERIIIIITSGAETVHETIEELNTMGEKVGLVKVRLFRPFDMVAFAKALPATTKSISVLDRSKEPGALGEPLYIDICTAIAEAVQDGVVSFAYPKIYAVRYGLAAKEFTPAIVKAIFDNMSAEQPRNHYTVGIKDDLMGGSLDIPEYTLKDDGRTECIFFGLGSDGTVGANKNSIMIIGNNTDNYAQGYFLYDSKKSGGLTISHLRFGSKVIRSAYLCTKTDFIACHNFKFLDKYDLLSTAKVGATFLLQSEFDAATVWEHLPDEVAQVIIDKKLKFYIVDAAKVAKALGLGGCTNTIMQTAFFAISGILPADKAIGLLKDAAEKAYGRKGKSVVQRNWDAIDAAKDAIKQVVVPNAPAGKKTRPPTVPEDATDFVKYVTAAMIRQTADSLPVSAIPEDGTWPTGTTQFEKRNIAANIPIWNSKTCIQCTKCTAVCPHAAIRAKAYEPTALEGAPETFKSAEAKPPFKGKKFSIQIAPEDCTGCGLCVSVCPEIKGERPLNMVTYDHDVFRKPEATNWKFFLGLPETDITGMPVNAKTVQMKRPLMEFSGACSGCGETPYVKMLTQLCGDHLIIANASGCSSVFGGNHPTTPYCKNIDGQGPAWATSLFEDNAEFGLGMTMTRDKQKAFASELASIIVEADTTPATFATLLQATLDHVETQKTDADIAEQRARVAQIKETVANCSEPCDTAKKLVTVADFLVRRSVWIIGGDGWAYDIGYSGLDHVLATGSNVKILVLDTEAYSNTGGQASKSTPLGAVAKFATNGKPTMKKDLAAITMTYRDIYVAQVSLGANPDATLKAFKEAEEYNGPALIIAYAHCIAHGIDLFEGLEHQRMAVESGHFPLFRYNPQLIAEGKNPLILDSKAPSRSFIEVSKSENRFRQLLRNNPDKADEMLADAEALYKRKFAYLNAIASMEQF